MGDLNKLSPLERIALRLSFEAPLRRGTHSSGALVDWETIEELRAELERLGFDWRAGVRVTQELEHKRRAEARARRMNHETA